jgi:hypothetical protein
MGQQETALMLKRASASRSSGEWNDDDFDVLADGVVVGRIFKANTAAVGSPWMWTLAFGNREGRTPTHSYAESREAAMARQELAAGVSRGAPRMRGYHSF